MQTARESEGVLCRAGDPKKSSFCDQVMSTCGEIVDVRMGVKAGQFQGFAHVDYADQSSADAAIALGAEGLGKSRAALNDG
jgi:hypothetical protein